MANTLIPVQTYTLTGNTSSVTFSNIPQGYTDLKVVASARSSSGSNIGFVSILLSINGVTSDRTGKRIYGLNGAAGSDSPTTGGPNIPTSTSTASTFGTTEYYFSNYSSTTQYKSFTIESCGDNNSSTVYELDLVSVLWSQNAAISSLSLSLSDSSSFVSGSTFTLYGISNGVKATGGTLTVAGGYAYHTFTSSGNFIPNQQITNADFLVVAGGGGGSRINAGGGAGGLRCSVDATGGGTGLESKLTFYAGNVYTAIVGAGGAGSGTSAAANGSNSIFGSITSLGGGGGGAYVGSGSGAGDGLDGGSGGGGGFRETAGSSVGGSGTYGQGYAGGGGTTLYVSGGGGGAGGAGVAGVSQTVYPGGNGGIGVSIPSFALGTGTGVDTYYAGGGGAGDEMYSPQTPAGVGGFGGGGNGANRTSGTTRIAGSAGTSNTGGGGGGGENGATNGYAGGSGIVIIRYPLS